MRRLPRISPNAVLTGLGVLSGFLYLSVSLTSQSLHEAGSGRNSLLYLLCLFGAAFVCYLAALGTAVRSCPNPCQTTIIVAGAVVFRLILLFSDPIEEIDIYRYLWDGEVITQGVSPFRYSPQQVLEASRADELPPDLDRLVRLRDSSPVLLTVLRRIHFGQLPTIYPPVSQAVFALNALLTPRDATLYWRMVSIKCWLVAFDLATFWLVFKLLKEIGASAAWSVAYGWCPLVIKEIANSGHVDSVAVGLTTLAALLAVRGLFGKEPDRDRSSAIVLSVAALALAVGAKLYPLVLAPLFGFTIVRRFGTRIAGFATAVFVALSLGLSLPMIPAGELAALPNDPPPFPNPQEFVDDLPPAPLLSEASTPRDPSQSLRVFLAQWEMNDFLFLLAVENLRPDNDVEQRQKAWFVVTPDSWRESIVAAMSHSTGLSRERVPFFLTRLLLSALYLGFACWIAWKVSSALTPDAWLRAVFLTLVWFWLLLPTANPWYLTWCLPFLPFAGSRPWFLLSGLTFAYYLRFWFAFYFSDETLLGTPYTGASFFDYVMTWIEFGPWFIWLGVDTFVPRSVFQLSKK